MKLQVQTALATLVLGMCSTMVFATGGGPAPTPEPDECREGICRGKIPIKVEVPKRCALKVPQKPIFLKDGDMETATFQVGANAKYNLTVDTANRVGHGSTFDSKAKNGHNSVDLEVKTYKHGSMSPIKLNDTQHHIEPGHHGWSSYDVKVKSEYVGMSKPAGIYSDEYFITVSF